MSNGVIVNHLLAMCYTICRVRVIDRQVQLQEQKLVMLCEMMRRAINSGSWWCIPNLCDSNPHLAPQ